MTYVSTFAAALRFHRMRRGFTQSQLADAAGIAKNTAARLERGEIEPSWPVVCQLADALRVPVSHFRKPVK